SQPTAKKAAKAKPRPKKQADGGAGDGPTPTQTEPAKTPTGDTPAVETAPKAPAPTNGEAPGEGKRPAPGDNEGGGKKPSPRKPTPGEKADAAGGKVAHAANQAAALIRAHDAYDEHRKD